MSRETTIDLSLASLQAYGDRYSHWAIAYSGGKDSTATVAFVVWAIQQGKVKPPTSLTILYADTRMELPPLQQTAMQFMDALRLSGIATQIVLPQMDDRFFVYMLGRGVPPPKNRFRWCTPQLKIEPMHAALQDLRDRTGEKLLMLTGVRLGESAARDQRIALSCSKDSGECGQGWFQVASDESVCDTLAPLLHWRLCHVWDWLAGLPLGDAQNTFYKITNNVAFVYGDGDVRTGCIGCNLASHDVALENLIQTPEWSRLQPLTELKPLYAELTKAKYRLRKSEPERRKDGKWSQNAQRLGPLTMDARRYALDCIKDIQRRASVDLINTEEGHRILELIEANTWPNGWDGDEIVGDVPIDAIRVMGDVITVQPRIL